MGRKRRVVLDTPGLLVGTLVHAADTRIVTARSPS